jgi:hypothetical protein
MVCPRSRATASGDPGWTFSKERAARPLAETRTYTGPAVLRSARKRPSASVFVIAASSRPGAPSDL